MKRFLRDSITTLEITINIVAKVEDVAAAQLITTPSNRIHNSLSDKELQILNNVSESILNSVRSRPFIIVEEYQSKRSYTYYVHFYPVTDTGEKLDLIKIIFRVSEHEMQHSEVKLESGSVQIVSFEMGNITFNRGYELINAAEELCERLYHGELEALDEYI